jgi:aromatic ring-opening dioxygenase catalytic subunit (LigB family)
VYQTTTLEHPPLGSPATLRSYVIPAQPLLLDEELAASFLSLHHALRRVSEELAESGTQVLLVVSAGWVTPDAFSVGACTQYAGVCEENFIGIIPYSYRGDPQLAQLLVERGADASLPIRLVAEQCEMDVSTVVALRALRLTEQLQVIPLSICPLSLRDSYRWGRVLSETASAWGKRVALLAVGGLSGRLDHREITAVSPEGKKHDEQVLRVLQSRAWNDLLNLDPLLSARAQPVGGMHHLAVLSGFAQQAREVQVLTYQGIIGTGNAVVRCV